MTPYCKVLPDNLFFFFPEGKWQFLQQHNFHCTSNCTFLIFYTHGENVVVGNYIFELGVQLHANIIIHIILHYIILYYYTYKNNEIIFSHYFSLFDKIIV